MRKSIALAAALLTATLPFAALGQETGESNAEEAQSELSLGTPENAEPQVGQTYVAEVFTDWELRCVRTEDGNDPCQLYQLLLDPSGNAVAEFSVFTLPEGQEAAAGATVITPLETLLTAQLRLAVDSGQAKRYPYSFCTQVGCFARLGFLDAEIEEFKRGSAANVTIIAAGAPEQPVELSMSLSGFTAGWDRLNNLAEE